MGRQSMASGLASSCCHIDHVQTNCIPAACFESQALIYRHPVRVTFTHPYSEPRFVWPPHLHAGVYNEYTYHQEKRQIPLEY
jgi:hypothetical protein